MAEDIGKMLKLLEITDLSNLYQSSIRQMQPVDLIRRLESEKVSTRGHMPEVRARLLRLEARKLYPRLDVPWYKEDELSEENNVDEENKKDGEIVKNKVDKQIQTTVQLEVQAVEVKAIEVEDRSVETESEENTLHDKYFWDGIIKSDKYRRLLNYQRQAAEINLKFLDGVRLIANKCPLENQDLDAFKQLQDRLLFQNEQNQQAIVNEENYNVSQPQEISAPQVYYESAASSPDSQQIHYKRWASSKSYTEFGGRNDSYDYDPFEHVDHCDWMDDYIE